MSRQSHCGARTAREKIHRPVRRQGWKPIRDAVIAFTGFSLVALTAGSGPSLARPSPRLSVQYTVPSSVLKAIDQDDPAPVVQIATVAATDQADAMYRRTSFSAAWMLLAASFALVVALNLAVARHLRQAYTGHRAPPGAAASPRDTGT